MRLMQKAHERESRTVYAIMNHTGWPQNMFTNVACDAIIIP